MKSLRKRAAYDVRLVCFSHRRFHADLDHLCAVPNTGPLSKVDRGKNVKDDFP